MEPHRRQPTRLPHPWDSPGKNTGVGCHFLLPTEAKSGYQQNNRLYHPGKWYRGNTECYTEEQTESAVREKDYLKIKKSLQKWQENLGFVIGVNQSDLQSTS